MRMHRSSMLGVLAMAAAMAAPGGAAPGMMPGARLTPSAVAPTQKRFGKKGKGGGGGGRPVVNTKRQRKLAIMRQYKLSPRQFRRWRKVAQRAHRAGYAIPTPGTVTTAMMHGRLS